MAMTKAEWEDLIDAWNNAHPVNRALALAILRKAAKKAEAKRMAAEAKCKADAEKAA